MDAHADNPADNIVGSGITEESLQKAISASGYPLQAEVAERFERAFADSGNPIPPLVQEEWSYIDSDSGTVRSIDALLEIRLPWTQGTRIRPVLNVLVECKQIELPTVFFTRAGNGFVTEYPRLVGHPHRLIAIKTTARSDTHSLTLSSILGLQDGVFNTLATPAVSMARVHRKGSGLELSGDDTYPNLIRPLIKATEHFSSLCKPHPDQCYFDLRMVATVAVVRGPMIGVARTEGRDQLTYIPWVRLDRLEPSTSEMFREYGELKPIDIIHASYVDSYAEHLLALAKLMAERIEKVTVPIILGEGKISKNQEKRLFDNVYKILRPTVTKQAFEEEMDQRMYRAHASSHEIREA